VAVAHIGANGRSLETNRGGEHEERAEDLNSSHKVRDHLVAYHLVPVVTDFIWMKIGNAATTNLSKH